MAYSCIKSVLAISWNLRARLSQPFLASERSNVDDRTGVQGFHLVTYSGYRDRPRVIIFVFPDLISAAHIKLNYKLKLLDGADEICSREPENFCPAASDKAVRRSYSV
jgi:hypothetical protein